MKLLRFFKVWLIFFALALLALQLYFFIRVGLMVWVDPSTTSFQRSEWLRLQQPSIAPNKPNVKWRHEWVDYNNISTSLKRAVIVSEDDGFLDHPGWDNDAMFDAWEKNQKESSKAERRQASNPKVATKKAKIVGGSTITQQLAKNLFLSGERSYVRKAQELLISAELELFLSKRRILEIYLNHVEWGEGIFGAQAAAQHYFHKNASQLSHEEAAKLAVMLPRPKYFEKRLDSVYLSERSAVIAARMSRARTP